MKRFRSKSRTRSRSRSRSRKRAGSKGRNKFVQGASYKVNGPGVRNEIWTYKYKDGSDWIFADDSGGEVLVYKHKGRYCYGSGADPIRFVKMKL